jgi:GTP-binding protein
MLVSVCAPTVSPLTLDADVMPAWFPVLYLACSVLGMVDGAVLLVDAVEGPLAQTKFVLAKALARGLAPVVVLNKVDRPAASQSRCDAVASQLFDLFASLGADDRQLDFPVLYASAKQVC